MEISSLLTAGVNYQASKTTIAEDNSSSKVNESTECSEAEKLEAFKKEIWNEISKMPWSSQVNSSVQITEGAFKRMMKDNDFKVEMLSIIREESIAGRSPIGTSLTWISEAGYKGFSYWEGEEGAESAFLSHSKSKDSFYSKKAVKKKDSGEEWEERALERTNQQKMFDKDYSEELMNKQLKSHREQIARLYEQNISFL